MSDFERTYSKSEISEDESVHTSDKGFVGDSEVSDSGNSDEESIPEQKR